jgi:glycerophosphoryl diester phosphodiesterase
MPIPFDVQGHRGARGLRPENTLPSFEAALDHCVSSIETDLLRTADGAIVLFHDFEINGRLCRSPNNATALDLSRSFPVREQTLAELRAWIADRNPDPARFSTQQRDVTPFSSWFAEQRGMHPYAVPTLADLIAFVEAYAREPGRRHGKTDAQRQSASGLILDLEVKRLPFREAERESRAMETALLAILRETGSIARSRVRSFDHATVRRLVDAEPRLTGGVLVAGTAPLRPARLATDVGASLHCPDYQFLTEEQVREVHAAGIRVIPWTVNEPAEWERLVAWGVDGITTDYPDRLAAFLQSRQGQLA